jgi:hypothetical protein
MKSTASSKVVIGHKQTAWQHYDVISFTLPFQESRLKVKIKF